MIRNSTNQQTSNMRVILLVYLSIVFHVQSTMGAVIFPWRRDTYRITGTTNGNPDDYKYDVCFNGLTKGSDDGSTYWTGFTATVTTNYRSGDVYGCVSSALTGFTQSRSGAVTTVACSGNRCTSYQAIITLITTYCGFTSTDKTMIPRTIQIDVTYGSDHYIDGDTYIGYGGFGYRSGGDGCGGRNMAGAGGSSFYITDGGRSSIGDSILDQVGGGQGHGNHRSGSDSCYCGCCPYELGGCSTCYQGSLLNSFCQFSISQMTLRWTRTVYPATFTMSLSLPITRSVTDQETQSLTFTKSLSFTDSITRDETLTKTQSVEATMTATLTFSRTNDLTISRTPSLPLGDDIERVRSNCGTSIYSACIPSAYFRMWLEMPIVIPAGSVLSAKIGGSPCSSTTLLSNPASEWPGGDVTPWYSYVLCTGLPVPFAYENAAPASPTLDISYASGRTTSHRNATLFVRVAGRPVIRVASCDGSSLFIRNCSLLGNREITVVGENFVYRGHRTRVQINETYVDYDQLRSNSTYMIILVPTLEWSLGGYQLTVSVIAPTSDRRQSLPYLINMALRPTLTKVSGCQDYRTATVRCSTTNLITLSGLFNLNQDTTILVNGVPCGKTTVVSSTALQCSSLVAGGTVTVVQNKVYSFTLEQYYIDMSLCVRNSRGICGGHGQCMPTAECNCTGSGADGYWAKTDQTGGLCIACDPSHWGPTCMLPCECSMTGVCDRNTGKCTSCSSGYAGPTCSTQCKGYLLDGRMVCDGHGSCFEGLRGNGSCVCFPSWRLNTTSGSCTECDDNHFGDVCHLTCLCSGHGVCSSGRTGTGKCTCFSGYFGERCDGRCDASQPSTLACGGHGSCVSSKCVCFSNLDTGYWTTNAVSGMCTDCAVDYANSTSKNCTLPCPGYVNGAVCSGHGSCTMGTCSCILGYCGQSCSVLPAVCSASCTPAYMWGETCSNQCPGTKVSDGTVCNGHGQCVSGRLGTGECQCDVGVEVWGGTSCAVSCTKMCGAGMSCTDTTCMCTNGGVGPRCMTCPNRCSSRGDCIIVGDVARCACYVGYIGTTCESQCPNEFGGTFNPCSGHGECTISGCLCKSDKVNGFWTGTTCSSCLSPYVGLNCTSTCPGIGTPCSGHGECSSLLGRCVCYSDYNKGFWTGNDCFQCQSGYYGTSCSLPCPGGTCNPCMGHGTCDEGRTGSGKCSCVSPFRGYQCDDCAVGYFGPTCLVPCPTSIPTTICSSHGSCSDGRYGTGNCTCDSGYTGDTCNTCTRGYSKSNGLCVPCPLGGNGFPCSSRGECVNSVCVCDSGALGEVCSLECPRNTAGLYCSGHGRCAYQGNTAQCICTGNFAGSDCGTCSPTFYGSSCTIVCPGVIGTQPCSGHGVCRANATSDNTACACVPGYVGIQCELPCAGSPYCTGNGDCVLSNGKAVCVCRRDPDRGYWQGEVCSTCFNNLTHVYLGTHCDTRCPQVNGTICNGHGLCFRSVDTRGVERASCNCQASFNRNSQAIYCGNACEVEERETGGACTRSGCPYGFYGTKCTNICPGMYGYFEWLPYALAGTTYTTLSMNYTGDICSGHGSCTNDRLATGGCVCKLGYVGFNCSTKCEPCIYGKCSSEVITLGRCICDPGAGGPACSKLCGVSALGLCSVPRGTCDVATGSCNCDVMYIGQACQLTCPGSGIPCNGHGTCVPNNLTTGAVCSCHASATNGFWAGASCLDCKPPYVGKFCNATCPGTSDVISCSGHGQCDGTVDPPRCLCTTDGYDGYWSGDSCDTCSSGYFGSSCREQCVGGACVPCSGHGVCDDGIQGNGSCTCYSSVSLGYWRGVECADCDAGYYGLNCSGACPGGPLNMCSSHGLCDAGTLGTGECTCDVKWKAPYCDNCVSGYYGADCSKSCPEYNNVPCGGELRGTCNGDVTTEEASCICANGFTGPACQVSCPMTNGRVCNLHGRCVAATSTFGSCTCDDTAATGHWSGLTCQKCLKGYCGTTCDQVCPGGVTNPCSRRGITEGCNQDGTCTCRVGFGAPDCSVACPVGRDGLVCAGHGTCNYDGSCVCSGNWDNNTGCAKCLSNYVSESTGCLSKCPGDNNGIPCNGRGTCVVSSLTNNATCTGCLNGYCGFACELGGPSDATTCVSLNCAAGRWGPKLPNSEQCSYPCPAYPNVCSSHGKCLDGVYGTGVCQCVTGYTGLNCSIPCSPCDHGTCADDGSCLCDSGYGGPTCANKCGEGSERVFCGDADSVNGYCSWGTKGTGTCTCFSGWGGSACVATCPGLVFITQVNGTTNISCSGHGTCTAQPTPSCTCQSRWTGVACDVCVSGYYGPDCNLPCPASRGKTVGTSCQCLCNGTACFYGESCGDDCPVSNQGTVCDGHGKCDYGTSGSGFCKCDTNYYREACDKYCIVQIDCQGYNLNTTICGLNTGECECVASSIQGYWGGDRCESCDDAYFGLKCQQPCPCNNHGTCSRLTGECACYQNEEKGFWTSDACNKCSPRYTGDLCNIRAASPAVSGYVTLPILPSTFLQRSPSGSFTFVDDKYGRVYVGARPIVALKRNSLDEYDWDNSKSSEFALMAGFGTVWSVTVDGDFLRFFVVSDGGGMQTWSFDRSSLTLIATSASGAKRTLLQTQSSATGFKVIAKVQWKPTIIVMIQQYVGNVNVLRFIDTQTGNDHYLYPPRPLALTTATCISINSRGDVVIGGSTANGDWALESYVNNGSRVDVHVSQPLTLCKKKTTTSQQNNNNGFVMPTTLCSTVHRVVLNDNGTAYAVLSHPTNLLLVTIDVSGKRSPISVFLGKSAGGVCTAITLDTVGTAGYLAFNVVDDDNSVQPSIITAFNTVTGQIMGYVPLDTVNDESEVAAKIEPDPTTRLLKVTTATLQPRVIEINMFAVQGLLPDVANLEGIGQVTILGLGFKNVSNGGYCRYQMRDSSFVDTPIVEFSATGSYVVCSLPPEVLGKNATSTTDEAYCTGLPVEVSIHNGERFTSNSVTLRRQPAPIISNVSPDFATLNRAQAITIQGTGFLQTPRLSCRVMDMNTGRYRIVSARLLSSVEVECILKPTYTRSDFVLPGTPGATQVAVSLDGYAFSLGLSFQMLGTPAALLTTPRIVEVVSNAESLVVPKFTIDIVDSAQQVLDLYSNASDCYFCEPTQYKIQMIGADINAYFNARAISSDNVMTLFNFPLVVVNGTRGVVTVDRYVLGNVPTGLYRIKIVNVKSNISTLLNVSVVQGEPTTLAFVPSSIPNVTRGNYELPLDPAPAVWLVDAAGNIAIPKSQGDVEVTLHLLSYTPRVEPPVLWQPIATTTFAEDSGKFDFSAFRPRVIAKFGRTYAFIASGLLRSSNKVLRNATTRPMLVAAPCEGDGTYVQMRGETKCTECPTNGVCNNTDILIPMKNYWRYSPYTLDLIKCHPKKLLCEGIIETGKCRPGHKGIKCNECEDGHGKDGDVCVPCPPKAQANFVVFLLIVLFLFVCLWLVRSAVNSTGRNTVVVDAKLMMTYIQLTGQLGHFSTSLPLTVRNAYDAAEVTSTFYSNFAAVDCSGANDRLDIFASYMVIPLLIVPIFSFLYAGVVRFQAKKVPPPRTRTRSTSVVSADGLAHKETTVTDSKGDDPDLSVEAVQYYNYVAAINYSRRLRNPKAKLVMLNMERLHALDDPHLEEKQLLEENPTKKSFRGVFVVTSIVLLNLVYLTLVAQCANVLSCEPISTSTFDLDSETIIKSQTSFLVQDYSVSCDSEMYQKYYKAGIAFSVIYGFGIPAGAALGFLFLRKRKGEEFTNRLFTFMVSGYKPEYWFWECVVMFRKGLLVFIILFSSQDVMRTYLAMWWITLNLVGLIRAKPYAPDPNAVDSKSTNSIFVLDCVSLAAIIVQLNLSLLYQFDDTPEWMPLPPQYIALSFLLFIIFVSILFYFVKKLVQAAVENIGLRLGIVGVTVYDLRALLHVKVPRLVPAPPGFCLMSSDHILRTGVMDLTDDTETVFEPDDEVDDAGYNVSHSSWPDDMVEKPLPLDLCLPSHRFPNTGEMRPAS
eukprot:PhF_6_TR15919/c0_g1_i1/m.24618